MEQVSAGQVSSSAAEVYDNFFVPALFEQWGEHVVRLAHLQPGHSVLDVACGTGALARQAAHAVLPGGTATGLDRNDGMLAVAQRVAPGIEWRLGLAEDLPFDDNRFDAVVSQFGLMFFDDRRKAIGEMWRVLRPGGHLAVAVWDTLDHTPGYRALAALLARLFGQQVAEELEAPSSSVTLMPYAPALRSTACRPSSSTR